jgi:hypothetical protein
MNKLSNITTDFLDAYAPKDGTFDLSGLIDALCDGEFLGAEGIRQEDAENIYSELVVLKEVLDGLEVDYTNRLLPDNSDQVEFSGSIRVDDYLFIVYYMVDEENEDLGELDCVDWEKAFDRYEILR